MLAELAGEGGVARPVAILHVDLDRFKAINDAFGHAAGDHVLRTVAGILRAAARRSDYIARVGGDEFVIVLRSDVGEEDAQAIAERIIEACRRTVRFEDRELHFGASVGIAIAPREEAAELLQRADIALYEAKSGGRNCSALFSPRLQAIAAERKRVADDLVDALAEDIIEPHYQPQVCARTRSFAGVEALGRWTHPQLGPISPDVFVPLAEELGLLRELDDRILRKSIDMVSRLRSRGISVPKLAVNIGYRRLQTGAFLHRIEELHPLPCRLALELVETIDFDQDIEAATWVLEQLRAQEVEIEIDDFGSGRASITTLLRLRPDAIKIDRQLTSALLSPTTGSGPLVKAISEMSRSLGISLTAEGVETELQAGILTDLQCDVFQGFLFAPALEEAQLAKWIADWVAQDPVGGARPLTRSVQ